MSQADEMERTVAFRASVRFPSPARLAAGRERLLAATLAGRDHEAARPWRARPHALAGPRRRAVLAASAAAALVVLGGVGYGATTAITGHAAGPADTGVKTAAFTSVNGCASLDQVSGTLEQVNGTSLVVKTAGGQLVTVATTASTGIDVAGAPVSDITDGASVAVAGSESDGAVAAVKVTVGNRAPLQNKPTPPGSSTRVTTGVAAQGTVSDASGTGFTVITSDGTQIPVTTSSDTLVNLVQADIGQLQVGATAVAFGDAGPDGTLSAVSVLQPPPGAGVPMLRLTSCTPSAVDNAVTMALVSGK